MKLSVILGVAQMSLGVFMKAFNALYYKHYVDFFFEFIPQIILLWALFGFMDLIIITKWTTDYSAMVGANPPSVITMMIDMCLGLGAPSSDYTILFNNQ